jgi:2-dehydropantoate 2-reductase
MRVAIFGAGGAGGFFGALLCKAGEDVVVIARGEHLEAIRENGLRINSIDGDFVVRPRVATDSPEDIGPVDMILLGVKAWQVPEVAPSLSPMLGPETVVLPLQNGVETANHLVTALGENHVLGGLAKIISYKSGPGEIRHVGAHPYIAFGELDGRQTDRINRIRTALEQAGVTVDIFDDIQAALWNKFLFVVSWGGVGAATDSSIGVIRSVPETRRMLEQTMDEIYAVAIKRNIALPDHIVQDTMKFVDSLPYNGTASLQRDIAEGKPSELDAWNGAVVRLGREMSVEVPLNTFIYNSLLPRGLKARGQLQ